MSTVTPSRPVPRPRPGGARPARPRATFATTLDPFRVLRRHMLTIIGSAVVGTVVGVAAYFVLTRAYPLYRGEYLFEVRAGLEEAMSIGTNDLNNDDLAYRIANTETALLTSREVLKAAVAEPETQNTKWFQKGFVGPGGAPLIEEAVDELEEDVRSVVVRRSNLFGLSWSTHAAADVPVVINNIAKAYLDKRKQIDNSLFSDSLQAFQAQLNQTNRDLEDLNQEIKTFIREKGITTLEDVKYSQKALQMQILTSRITEAQATLNQLQTAYMQTAAKLEGTIEPTSEDKMEAELDAQIRAYDSTVLGVKTELRVLREQYPYGHRRIDELEMRLRALQIERDNKLQEIIERNLNARLKAFANQIEQYQGLLEELEETAETEDKLLRDLTADQAEYEAMEKRREFLEVSRDADLGLIKEVQLMRLRADAARVRTAQIVLTPRELYFPQPEIIIPLGLLLGVALTVGVIFLREISDQRVKSASDLTVIPGAEVLGMIPEIGEDPTGTQVAELAVRKHPTSVLAESYRQAFAPIFKDVERSGHQTLMFVGGLPGAGSTSIITNIAAAWAGAGKNVVVVDANFRRPRLAEAMGVKAEQGLGDVIAGQSTVDDVLEEAGENVHVVSAGTAANRIVERLHTVQFDSALAELRSRFDYVIFDVPPAVVAGEAMILANKLDAAVMVVRAYSEQRGLVARLIGQLADARCELLGIVLNRPRRTAGGYLKKNYETMATYAETPRT